MSLPLLTSRLDGVQVSLSPSHSSNAPIPSIRPTTNPEFFPPATIYPAPAYDFMQSAEQAHTQAGYNFAFYFNACFESGFLFKGPDYLLMGGHDPFRADAWHIWWAEKFPHSTHLDLIRTFLRLAPYHKPYISWARSLKKRTALVYYSTDRIARFIK